jgi:hypothetical protein
MIVQNAARATTRSIANVSPSSAIPFCLIGEVFATIFVVGTLRRAVTRCRRRHTECACYI